MANKSFFHTNFIWRIRNGWLTVKGRIKGFFVGIWNAITNKKGRDAAKAKREQELKDYLGITDPNYDLLFNLDIAKTREDFKIKISSLKENKSSSNDTEIKRLEYLYKIIPHTVEERNKRGRRIDATRAILKGLLYLSPVLVLLGLFTFYPLLNAFRLATYVEYKDGDYIGFTLFDTFSTVLREPNFLLPSAHTASSALINTVLIVVISVPLTIGIGLLIAVLLNSIKPLQSFFQTVFFLPYVTNTLAIGLVFAYMFRNDGGLINQMLSLVGVEGGAWVGVGATFFKAMFVLIIYTVWNGLAFRIMLFMSAIQGIDKQYYQAALIDATPRFKQFRRITVPLISPIILYSLITSVIAGFKTYTSVIAIFGNAGQPAGADFTMKTIVFYIFDYFKGSNTNLHKAAAASIILFAFILVLTLIQMQVSKKRVHY